MNRALVCIVLGVGLASKAQGGDLTTAGAVSGFGKGLSNSLSVIQQGLIQQSLMEEQAKLERARMEQLHRYQLEREERQYQRELERQQAVNGQSERQGVSRQPADAEGTAHYEATRRLEQMYPDWRQVIAPGSAYRQWLATQPASYQQLVSSTRDPAVVAASIDQFRQARFDQQNTIRKDLESELQTLQLEKARLDQTRETINAMPPSHDRDRALVTYNNHLNSYHARLDAYYAKTGQPSVAQQEQAKSQKHADLADDHPLLQYRREAFLLDREYTRLETQRQEFEALTHPDERRAAMVLHNAQVATYQERLKRHQQNAP